MIQFGYRRICYQTLKVQNKILVGHCHPLTGWYQWSFWVVWPNTLWLSPANKVSECIKNSSRPKCLNFDFLKPWTPPYKLSSLPNKYPTAPHPKINRQNSSHHTYHFVGMILLFNQTGFPDKGFSCHCKMIKFFGTTNNASTWSHGRLCLFCVVDEPWWWQIAGQQEISVQRANFPLRWRFQSGRRLAWLVCRNLDAGSTPDLCSMLMAHKHCSIFNVQCMDMA